MNYVLFIFYIAISMLPEFSWAANTGVPPESDLKHLVTDGLLGSLITTGLVCYTGVLWFLFWVNFNPQTMLKDMWFPILMGTFAAFWRDFLTALNII